MTAGVFFCPRRHLQRRSVSPCCPSLNVIERLWGHLKRTILANVLFVAIEDLMDAFRRGVGRINGHRNQMGFMFDHDDIHKKAA